MSGFAVTLFVKLFTYYHSRLWDRTFSPYFIEQDSLGARFEK